jgi:hypothetical protein
VKIALIPPISLLDNIFRTDYQLLLPHLTNDMTYYDAYREARKRGDFLILDNGAAEGHKADNEELLATAEDIMVQEVVMPDVLGDLEGTKQEVLDFNEHLYRPTNIAELHDFRYMGVIQGQTWNDVITCIDFYNSFDHVTTLGIPRILLDTLGDPEARLSVCRNITERYGSRFALHLLGTNPNYIRELSRFGSEFVALGVRGVDTSAPFNYANCGKFVEHFDNISRPGEYFHLDQHHFDNISVKHNCQEMIDWVTT